jgi:hypothetical protein
MCPVAFLSRSAFSNYVYFVGPGYVRLGRLYACVDIFHFFQLIPETKGKPGKRSMYSNWLQAGQPRAPSSRPSGIKKFLFYRSSRSVLESIYPLGTSSSSEVKRPRHKADHLPPTCAEAKKIRLHCVVLN